MSYLWPIILVIGANTVYNVVAKSTPQNVNPFISLAVTYLVAAAVSVILFFVSSTSKNIFTEIGKVNWTAFIFGLSIIGLEFGYINIYRLGWKVSTASLIANIALAVILLIIGVLAYKESISLKQIIGIITCAGGLILVTK